MEETLAVLIDFENIAAGAEKDGLGRFDVHAVMARVKDKGRILVSRSYADWGRFARYKQDLLRANVTMFELTSHGMQDKNRADIAMVVDCLELALTRDYISTYVIVSGDSDFTPLAQKLREHNKRVIGCGCRSSTSRLLIDACDEFFFYDEIATNSRRQRSSQGRNRGNRMTRDAAFELAAVVVQGLQREDPEPALATVVKGAMLRRNPAFSLNDLRFSSFARFLDAAETAGKVHVVRDPKSGAYRVDLVDAASTSSSGGSAAQRHEGAYIDEYTPKGAHDLVKALAARGFDPLSAPTRRTLLEMLEEVVADRRKRRRRVTARFVQEDVRKRMRRTNPGLPKESVNGLFDALLKANVLMHRDGTPIRSFQAPFTLDRDAEKLNEALMGLYLSEIREGDIELPSSEVLAELFLGNPERARQVEEALAWLAAPPAADGDAESKPSVDLNNDIDLDGLLVFEETEEAPKTTEPVASDLDNLLEMSSDDVLVLEDEPAAEAAPEVVEEAPKKPARKRTRKKTTKAEPAAEAAPEPEAPAEAPAAEPEAVAEPEAAAAAEPAGDDVLLVEEAEEEAPPKRKPRRRRTTKKTEEEA